jgi:hypothetical protein
MSSLLAAAQYEHPGRPKHSVMNMHSRSLLRDVNCPQNSCTLYSIGNDEMVHHTFASAVRRASPISKMSQRLPFSDVEDRMCIGPDAQIP